MFVLVEGGSHHNTSSDRRGAVPGRPVAAVPHEAADGDRPEAAAARQRRAARHLERAALRPASPAISMLRRGARGVTFVNLGRMPPFACTGRLHRTRAGLPSACRPPWSSSCWRCCWASSRSPPTSTCLPCRALTAGFGAPRGAGAADADAPCCWPSVARSWCSARCPTASAAGRCCCGAWRPTCSRAAAAAWRRRSALLIGWRTLQGAAMGAAVMAARAIVRDLYQPADGAARDVPRPHRPGRHRLSLRAAGRLAVWTWSAGVLRCWRRRCSAPWRSALVALALRRDRWPAANPRRCSPPRWSAPGRRCCATRPSWPSARSRPRRTRCSSPSWPPRPSCSSRCSASTKTQYGLVMLLELAVYIGGTFVCRRLAAAPRRAAQRGARRRGCTLSGGTLMGRPGAGRRRTRWRPSSARSRW